MTGSYFLCLEQYHQYVLQINPCAHKVNNRICDAWNLEVGIEVCGGGVRDCSSYLPGGFSVF